MLLLLALPYTASGQAASESFTVKGCVVDSITKEGEPYATINIKKKEKPEETLKMVVTNAKGEFNVSTKGTGDFTVTISSMGRESIVRDFNVKTGQKAVDLGTLYIYQTPRMSFRASRWWHKSRS